MRIKFLAAVFASCFLAACGSSEPESTAETALPALATLPATVEGDLVVDVAEGDVEEDGTSEFNFGTLTVGGNEIAVQVSGSVMQSAGLSDSGGKVRATLSSKTDQYGLTVYTVSSLQRL